MLIFIQAYWRPLLISILLAISWVSGDYHGHSIEDAKWQAKFDAAELAASNRYEELQKTVDIAESNYQKEKIKNDQNFIQAEKDLSHAYAKNPDYTKCHADNGFMQSYRTLAGTATIVIPLARQ